MSDCCDNKSINWKTTIELIEVYRMTTELEKTWAGKVLNDKELKDYAKFEHELKHERPATKIAFEKRWQAIFNQIKVHLYDNPNSDIGIEVGTSIDPCAVARGARAARREARGYVRCLVVHLV